MLKPMKMIFRFFLMILISILSFISCDKKNFQIEYYPNGNLKKKMEVDKNGKVIGNYEEYFESGELRLKASGLSLRDTVFIYYKSGSIKEKGLMKDGIKRDWWILYDTDGNKTEMVEYYKENNDTLLKNQNIKFSENGKIDFKKSWFFKVNIPDTISLGNNKFFLDYYSNFPKEDRFRYIIIESFYSDGKIKKDTFYEDDRNFNFNVRGRQVGKFRIKAKVVEEVLSEKISVGDSLELIQTNYKKYFQKELYVKDDFGNYSKG